MESKTNMKIKEEVNDGATDDELYIDDLIKEEETDNDETDNGETKEDMDFKCHYGMGFGHFLAPDLQNEASDDLPTQEELINDDLLKELPVRALNQRLKWLTKEDVAALKLKRRTLKNRDYARTSRQKRISRIQELEGTNRKLRDELNKLKREMAFVVAERNWLREKYGCNKEAGNTLSSRLGFENLQPRSGTSKKVQEIRREKPGKSKQRLQSEMRREGDNRRHEERLNKLKRPSSKEVETIIVDPDPSSSDETEGLFIDENRESSEEEMDPLRLEEEDLSSSRSLDYGETNIEGTNEAVLKESGDKGKTPVKSILVQHLSLMRPFQSVIPKRPLPESSPLKKKRRVKTAPMKMEIPQVSKPPVEERLPTLMELISKGVEEHSVTPPLPSFFPLEDVFQKSVPIRAFGTGIKVPPHLLEDPSS